MVCLAMRRWWFLFGILMSVAVFGDAAAASLAGEWRARLVEKSKSGEHVASFRISSDGIALADPRCPASGTLRISTSTESGPVLPLACDRWKATRKGYKYVDKAGTDGPVRLIVYGRSRLLILTKG